MTSGTHMFMVNAAGCVCVSSSVECIEDSTSMLRNALLQLLYPSLCSSVGGEVVRAEEGRT